MRRRTAGILLLPLGAAFLACTTSVREPVSLAPAANPPVFEAEEPFLTVAAIETIPANAFVRLQGEPNAWKNVPYLGEIEKSRASDDVVTIDYGDLFRDHARRFAAAYFPNGAPYARSVPVAGGAVRVQIKLAKTTYHRGTHELRQYVTLRILDHRGTVVFQTVAETAVTGELPAEQAILYTALEENFRALARVLATSREKILADIRFSGIDFASLEAFLLRAGAPLGRSPSQRSEDNGRQFAVIIGISDYRYDAPDLPDLRAARKDALDVHRALNDPDNRMNFQDDRIVLLLDEDATLRNIRGALNRWLKQKVGENDTVLIYFAGHGLYDIDLATGSGKKEKYFLPADFDPSDDTFASGLPMDEITEYFAELDAKNTIMVFDACHAGAAGSDDRTDELWRFARMRGSNRVNAILAAAKSTQVSTERGENGVFTEWLVRGLRGPADENADGRVTVLEAAGFVAREVPIAARREGGFQEPVLKVNDRSAARDMALASF